MTELSKQEQMIKDYLEEQIKKDEALRNVYNAENIHECFEYIVKLAREMAVNGCAMVEDAVVYHWAREWYLEDRLHKKPEESKETAEEKPEEVKEPAETKVCHVKTTTCAVVKDGSLFDESGNGLLFEM